MHVLTQLLWLFVIVNVAKFTITIYLESKDVRAELEEDAITDEKYCQDVCSTNNVHRKYGKNVNSCATACRKTGWIRTRAFIRAYNDHHMCGIDVGCWDSFWRFAGSFSGIGLLAFLGIFLSNNWRWIMKLTPLGALAGVTDKLVKVDEDGRVIGFSSRRKRISLEPAAKSVFQRIEEFGN
jgi:hypothetical protein